MARILSTRLGGLCSYLIPFVFFEKKSRINILARFFEAKAVEKFCSFFFPA